MIDISFFKHRQVREHSRACRSLQFFIRNFACWAFCIGHLHLLRWCATWNHEAWKLAPRVWEDSQKDITNQRVMQHKHQRTWPLDNIPASWMNTCSIFSGIDSPTRLSWTGSIFRKAKLKQNQKLTDKKRIVFFEVQKHTVSPDRS